MVRKQARVDDNQAEIVRALEDVGASVLHLHQLGRGAPDLLVGFRGLNYCMEIKDGNKAESRRRLTDDELLWHTAWRGSVYVVESVDDALQRIGAVRYG